MPLRVKKLTYDIYMFDSNYLMHYISTITLIENTLRKIYICGSTLDEFVYTYYDDKDDKFGLLFQKYTDSSVDNTYYLSIVKEWKYNIDKAYYEDKLHMGVYLSFY